MQRGVRPIVVLTVAFKPLGLTLLEPLLVQSEYSGKSSATLLSLIGVKYVV